MLPLGTHSVPPEPPAVLGLARPREPGWSVPVPSLPLPPFSSLTVRGLRKLISAIYADYARSLKNLGFKQGALLFASKAGAAGRDLLNELESPKQEPVEE